MEHATGSPLVAVAEAALAPLSFVGYRAARSVVQRLVRRHDRTHPAQASVWRMLDAEALKPLNLLALMTSAPRWNTHALIALAGPLPVRSTVHVHAATAARSAPSWTVVVHAEPSHRIVASLGPAGDTDADGWQALELPPGNYRLALRYYQWFPAAELPAIEVDGSPTVAPLAVPDDANSFYQALAGRKGLLYLGMHSYVCTLLRYRRWFPRSFVEREYLPAGNPRTAFRYGFVPAGSQMDIELDPALLQTSDVYFTAYNRASFPVAWYPLTETAHRTRVFAEDGTYLIRIHARPACEQPGQLQHAAQAAEAVLVQAGPHRPG